GDRRGGSSAPDAEAMKKLQGLGYVAGAQDQATSAFDPTLEDPKDFLPTYRRLVRASGLLASQPEEAAAELQEIVKSRPELLAAHMLLFQKALTDHRTADARQLLDRIATLRAATGDASKRLPGATWKDVAVPLCHTELGQALMAEGKMPEAAVEFENALRLDPSLRDTRYYLALARQRQGKLDEAIAQYRKALQIDPGFANAWNNLGAALREQNKPQEAADCFAKALEADPDHADAHYNLAAFLQQTGKLPEAIEHYEQALRINPDLAKTTNVTAALAGARKAVAAIERCRQALRARPDDPEARNNLGAELSQCGQTAQAIEQFEQALRARPDYAEAHYNLALARERTGAIPEAIAHYTQALQRKGDLLPALNNLAWLLATQNDPSLRNGPEAVRLAERACQLTGRKQGALLDTLAAAYAQAGQFPDAIAAAQEALALVQAANQPASAADIQSRLSGYRAGHAFRDRATVSPASRP
ncbi:MAG: tetratricopeptide repeat protein, partial [Planctomycetota bacterium]|nr:tetratricopeptide repeat protein [Planctomycetota bacterium]